MTKRWMLSFPKEALRCSLLREPRGAARRAQAQARRSAEIPAPLQYRIEASGIVRSPGCSM